MRVLCVYMLLGMLACGTCLATEVVEVRITPFAYQLGDVKSTSATSVVDEVVRLKPKSIVVMTCTDTPPAKVIQFQRELDARHQVKMVFGLNDHGCQLI